jgi:hypothetical protein
VDQSRTALVLPARGQEELTVQLRPLPSLRGRVIHMSGSPVRRFHLELLPKDSFESLEAHFLGDQFELRNVPLGRSVLFVTVDDGRRAQVPISMSPGVNARVEIPVHSGVPLSGRIVDASSGAPMGEVYVIIPLSAHTTTTRDGRFTFRDLPPGEHELEFSRGTSHASHAVTLKPDQTLDLGDLALPAP